MTPEARLSAVIELYDQVQSNALEKALSADVAVKSFFRTRRYAGSKDRRAISNLVYDILRGREELIWRLNHAEMEHSSRNQLICHLILTDSFDAALFGSGPYAPDALSVEEMAFIKNVSVDRKVAHDRVAGNCPKWLEERLRARFGDGFEAEMKALNQRAPLDVRVQTLRADRDKIHARLEGLGIKADLTSYSPLGIRLHDHVALMGVDAYSHGLIDVQDEGAQIASLLVDAKPKMQVLDLCAGAGGKSLTIAGQMNNTGQIMAMDVDRNRLKALDDRVNRARFRNIQKKQLTNEGQKRKSVLSAYDGKMDRVVLDVPCSGSGTWRRSPELRIRFDDVALAGLVKTQAQLLDESAPLVKPGGRLVYITCSLIRDENEDQINGFLERHADWALVPWRDVWINCLNGEAPISVSDEASMLQLTPNTHGTDGFFVAILERKVK
ncbi:MAG: RsmB/NOP family class I SAM-dependent RNA methyltransferase [Sphingomonadales bacterium]|nr:RsmB/NOP family class I SAM-dependent RNA methyltransferase [Sphingomonadales bacterium]